MNSQPGRVPGLRRGMSAPGACAARLPSGSVRLSLASLAVPSAGAAVDVRMRPESIAYNPEPVVRRGCAGEVGTPSLHSGRRPGIMTTLFFSTRINQTVKYRVQDMVEGRVNEKRICAWCRRSTTL